MRSCEKWFAKFMFMLMAVLTVPSAYADEESDKKEQEKKEEEARNKVYEWAKMTSDALDAEPADARPLPPNED